ncbi:MAG: hypothetical protein AYK23_03045 [Candidatus Proteinoplasmatales archaeon SG8-5]|nr:MAG: hypothetical protein AYK23_03045 [Candidatus Proteinoplasmatales archaeon SG8-5]
MSIGCTNYINRIKLFWPMEEIEVALPDYISVLRKERQPRFKALKAYSVDFDPTQSFDVLMEVHDKVLSRFKDGEPARRTSGGSEKHAVATLNKSGQTLLDLKLALAGKMLDSCRLCERRCGVDRTNGQKGRCGVLEPRISSEFLHFGEEPELVPSYTIFFSGCTFECVFCQNCDISQYPSRGEYFAPKVVADLIARKEPSARNVNWVGGDPTSNLEFILEVLSISATNLPQVWNSNMYLTEETMKLLDCVIDLYLTDFKYGNSNCGERLSKVKDYWEVITRNHMMAREQAEVIIRHLVLPHHVDCCSKPALDWISQNLGNGVRVNVMAQYRPMYQASDYPEISKSLKTAEFLEARNYAFSLGLNLVE